MGNYYNTKVDHIYFDTSAASACICRLKYC